MDQDRGQRGRAGKRRLASAVGCGARHLDNIMRLDCCSGGCGLQVNTCCNMHDVFQLSMRSLLPHGMGHLLALHRHFSQGIGNCNLPQRFGCMFLVLSCKLTTNFRAPVFCTQTIIGRQLKQFLDMPDNMKIGYSVFVSRSCPVGLSRVIGFGTQGLAPLLCTTWPPWLE